MADHIPHPGDGDAYPVFRHPTPVLTRGPGVLQIGFDQHPAVVLMDVPPGLDQVLSMLDGCHSRRELAALASRLGIAEPYLGWALRTLSDAGMVVGNLRERRQLGSAGTRVRLVGAGQLGKAVATLLVRSGLGVLDVIDNEAPDLAVYPESGALGSQAEGLRAFLGEWPATAVRVANHWTKPEDSRPDLTIVATDRLECDRVLAADLVRADQPHLLLRARADGVLVGPLVLPGHSPCLGCTDLARRDADPAWPMLLTQLVRTRLPIDPALLGWAGGVAAASALAFLTGAGSETQGATMEMSTLDYRTRWRSWSMHPGCGCGWGRPAQWEA